VIKAAHQPHDPTLDFEYVAQIGILHCLTLRVWWEVFGFIGAALQLKNAATQASSWSGIEPSSSMRIAQFDAAVDPDQTPTVHRRN
jgi:hypothetical protein